MTETPELDPDLSALIRRYTARYPALADPISCRNSCLRVATDLIEELAAEGRRATELWFRGHRDPRTPALPVPQGLDGSEHVAVVVDDRLIIDLTRRQFDPEAELPTIYASTAAAARDWRWFNPDPRRVAPWQRLP